MGKKFAACLIAFLTAVSFSGCSDNNINSPDLPEEQHPSIQDEYYDDYSTDETTVEEVAVQHISPMEKITANMGSQLDVNQVIGRAENTNTMKFPISEFVREGDSISSFTFVVHSTSGNIGEFKGGCGISVDEQCKSANHEGWFQSEDFTAPTTGTYGEINWVPPADVAAHISVSGEVLFGYWWGNVESLVVDSVICTYTRTVNTPVDGTVSQEIGSKVSYSSGDNCFRIPNDFVPEGNKPEVITFDLSAAGNIEKFNGAFGFESSGGSYTSNGVAMFTEGTNLKLTWFVPDDVKSIDQTNGEYILNYWWSKQPEITLDSVTVKYSSKDSVSMAETISEETPADVSAESMGFRSSKEIADAIKIGWNLGNTLDCYNTGKTGIDTETGWGNLKTTPEMINSVKNAGFNAVRIPVTWGEHLSGDTIQKEWLDRVQEVVDYAYNEGLFVIIDMHHDDYIWLTPNNADYAKISGKVTSIWKQISERFKDYDDRLLFEGLNEPRTIGSSKEWIGGTAEERAVINRLEADFVNTVRASGGKNADRTLIVTSYAASAETVALDGTIVPKDKNIIFTVHYYAPWKFAEGTSTVFDVNGESELEAKFAELKSKFIDKGIPVIIDEFGCVNVADEATRTKYYKYYVSAAKAQGIKCFLWDNGIAEGKDGYAIFSRDTFNWNTSILNAVIEGSK